MSNEALKGRHNLRVGSYVSPFQGSQLLFGIVILFMLNALVVYAQNVEPDSATTNAKIPLFEQEPHDKIYLDELNENAVLKVIPLDFPNRRVPLEWPSGSLTIQYLDQPNKHFQVDWSHIRKIELYEELILAEAKRLTQRRKFDEAYWYYEFLYQNFPATKDLSESIYDYLVKNAQAEYRAGRYRNALSMLEEVQQRNLDKLGVVNGNRRVMDQLLGKYISRVMDKLIGQYIDKKEYWQARQLLTGRDRQTSPEWNEMLARWEAKLNAIADRHLDDAQNHRKDKRYREALDAMHQALEVSPTVTGGRELATQLAQEYPIVVVGVTQPTPESSTSATAAWSARRTTRLLHRHLIEFIGRGAEGGQYLCPWGALLEGEAGTSYQFQLRNSKMHNSSGKQLSSYEVSQSLLSMAEPTHRAYNATWSEILESVALVDATNLDIQLRHTFVRPEALLNVSIDRSTIDSSPMPSGPYLRGKRTARETLYISQPGFALAGSDQPREIVERLITGSGTAVSLLESGEVDVIDRVNLRNLSQLENARSIVVERYDVPTVHVLVPNVKTSSLLANTIFRRALVYAIQRDVILNDLVLGGSSLEGCNVTSGPFPMGFTTDDPLGYAHSPKVEPRAYRPAMAKVLFGAAMEQAIKDSSDDSPRQKSLVLAYPQGDIPRIACRAIAEQLNAVMMPCTLKPLENGVTHPQDGFDLLYMEWTITEPVIDAARLFGSQGLVRHPSPYLRHTVNQLNRVTNWKEARDLLQKIHRIVHHEATVIPLWQIADHFAYHRRLVGIGTGPVHLYQNVEQWQIRP